MKAKDFEFNNKLLSEFGFILCNFGGSKGLETVSDGAEINFATVPTIGGSKHDLISSQYEDCLETTWQICKHSCNGGIQEITEVEHRNLTAWLCRKKFLKLKILDENNMDLYHEAKIDVSKIEIDGKLFGLELTVKTNRPFALKEPRSITIQVRYLYAWEKFYIVNNSEKGQSLDDYVFSYNRDAYPDDGCAVDDDGNITSSYYYVFVDEKTEFKNQHSINDTSYEEGYIYPEMEITIGNIDDKPINERSLIIDNSIENRRTRIDNCTTGEVITMNYPVIQSSDSSHNIQNDFNWNFFRVANTYDNSRNDLTISLPCSIKIKYSPIVKVGL